MVVTREIILKKIAVFKSGNYDQEIEHVDYESILECFIINHNPDLYDLMLELIMLEKDFWYA